MRSSLPLTGRKPLFAGSLKFLLGIMLMMAGLFSVDNTLAQGSMGRWEMCGLSGTPGSVSPSGVATGVTFSTLTRGPGISGTSATNAFSSDGWSTSGTLSTGNQDYYEFTITPDPGMIISISALRIRDQMSNTSFDVSVRYSDNSYGSSIGTGGSWVAATSATNRSVDMSGVASLQRRSTPVTFRIYGTDASSAAQTYRLLCQGTGAGNYRGVDVDGTVESAVATLGRWEMCGLSGTPSSVSPTGVSAGVSFSTLTRGAGLTASSATNAFNATNWSTATSLSIGNNDYYEFTITPEPGRSISISDLRIRDQMSNTSFDVSVRYSDNNYGSTIGSGGSWTAATTAENRLVNMSGVTSLQNRTAPVTFRIYGTDASSSSQTYRLLCEGTDPGDYRGVDVNGTVTHNAYVAEFISMDYGSSPWCRGELRDVSVTVKNVGSATWNSAEPVNIGLKWNEDTDYGSGPSFITRQPAGSVVSGQTVTYTFPAVAASTVNGNNNLTFDVVRELVCWFGNNGGNCGPGNSVFTSPTINVLAAPAATTVSGGGTFCDSRTITASGGTGGTIYFQGTTSGGTSTATPSTSQNITTSGTYYFRSRNGNGCWGDEGSTTVTINTTPSISVQPSSQSICEGGTVNLSVTASGSPAPTYQWNKNGSPIGGETSSTYSIPAAMNADGGAYTVDVINSCSTVTSAIANVVVNEAPAVTVDPVSQTICTGQPVTFTVTATGTNLAYQWRKGGNDIGGANGNSYTIPSVATGDGGNYDVVVSNTGCTSATSAAATLSVNETPIFTLDPVSQTVCEGANVTFTASASGVPGVTYQWQKDGSDINGETSTSLTINGLTSGDNGSYTVIATNICDAVTSAAATLLVNIAPAVTVDPVSQTICAGQPVTFTVTAIGTNLNYQWRKGGNDISGANGNSYTIASVVTGDAGNYDVVVSNTGCTDAISTAAVLSINEAPAFTLDPVSQTVCEGSNVTFTASASGVPGVTYQWQKDGSDISGETSASLTLNGVTTTDNGDYTVIATNICSAATSAAATLLVNVAPAVTVDPVSQTICSGQPVTFTVTATGTNLTYQWRKNGSNIGGATSTSYTIPSVVSGDAGNYDVVVSNTGCSSETSATAVLVVNERPTAVITSGNATICSTYPTTISGNVTATGAWTLTLSDNQTTNGTGNGTFSFTVNPASNTTYTLTALVDANCTSIGADLTGSAAISTNPLPASVSVDPSSATICNGQTIDLDANGTTTETNNATINNNFSSGFSVTGSVTGNRSQVFERETSTSNVNSTGAITSPNGTGMLVSTAAAQSSFCLCQATATSTANTTAEFEPISTMGYNTLNLTYVHTYAQANVSGSGVVQVSTNGTTWTTVKTYSSNQGSRTSFASDNISLNAYVNNPTLYVRFVYTASNSSTAFLQTEHATWWAIDDIAINGQLLPLYSWTADTGSGENGLPAGAGTPSADNLSISVDPSATTTYTLTATNPVTGCASTSVSTITVNDRPSADLSGGAVYCNGQTTTTTLSLAVTGAGTISGTLSDGTPFSGTAPTITVDVTPVSTTTYTVATLADDNCTALAEDKTGSATVTVNARPTAVLSGGASYCNGDVTTTTLTLTVTGSGTISGTLSDGTPFSGTAPAITVDVTPAATETYTIATLADENCTANGGDMSGSATVTINPLLPVSVSITSSDIDNAICAGTSVIFTATPVNEGPNPSYQWLLNGNPVGSNQDTYTTTALENGDVVSVVLTSDITPCAVTNPATSNSIATVVDELQPVSVTIVSSDEDNEICEGTGVTFTATPVNGGPNPSYQWLLNGNPVGADQDSYTTTALTNGDVVSVVLTSDITPCATGNPATSNSIATIVNANQPVSVVISSDAAAVCAGSVINFSLVPTNEGTNPTYQWYVNGNAITDSTNTTFAPEFLQDGDVVTVVLTSNITPCATQNPATSNSITVGISPIPTAPGPITGITDACPYTDTNIPVTFTIDPVPGVADYTWVYPANGVTYVSGQGTTSLTVTFQSNFALTNQYFRVQTNSSFPCSSAFSDHEVLKIIPAIAGPISGPVNVCEFVGQPTTATYSIDPVAFATGYTWTAPPNATIESGQGTTQVEVSFNSAFLGGSIRVSADANCGARAARSLALGKQGAQAPGPITGPINACPYLGNLTTATYTIDAVANATNYEWVVPANCNIVGGQGTTSLSVTFNANYSSGQIRVRAQSACNNSGYRAIAVANATYSAPGLISGPASACSYIGTATTATYKINKVLNAPSYLWTLPAGCTISAHPGGAGVNDTIIEVLFDNSFVNGSAISVQATGCITTAASTMQVFRSATSGMPGILSGPTNVCEYMMSTGNPSGTIAEYTVRKAQGATSYNWTAPSGATIVAHPNGAGANDTVVHVIYSAGFTSGAITVTSSNGCGNSSVRSLTVTKLQPMSPGGVAVAEIQSCPNRMFTYTMAALPANATGINWTVPTGGTIMSGQGTTSITVSYTNDAIVGLVTATPFNNCASSSTRNVSVKLAQCAEPKLITKTTVTDELLVSVYPNPSQHEFRVKIKSAENGKVQVRVLDVMGREMSRRTVASGEVIALGSELKAGTYFVEVIQNGKKSVNKVIKQ